MAINYILTIAKLQEHFAGLVQEAEGIREGYKKLAVAIETGETGVNGIKLTAAQIQKARDELAIIQRRVLAACQKYGIEPVEEE